MATTYIIFDLLDLFYTDQTMSEFDLIDAVQQILLEYPNPRLERNMRNFEEYFNNLGQSYYLYYDLLSNANTHLCTEIKKILMTSRIKRQFKRSMSDPNYKMCRDRLNKEFTSISISTYAT